MDGQLAQTLAGGVIDRVSDCRGHTHLAELPDPARPDLGGVGVMLLDEPAGRATPRARSQQDQSPRTTSRGGRGTTFLTAAFDERRQRFIHGRIQGGWLEGRESLA